MNYASIKNLDIANGSGIGISVFFSGCDAEPKCKGCFNSSIWDRNVGKPFTQETIDKIINLLSNPHIDHLSILGGDGLTDYNVESTLELVKQAKAKYPNKKIWLWTWRNYESLSTLVRGIGTIGLDGKLHPLPQNVRNDVLQYLDILVDGRFIEEKKNLNLKWCGSSNQRVIDVQQSLKQNKIVLYEQIKINQNNY